MSAGLQADVDDDSGLTARELDVLAAVAAGATDAEVAVQLGLAVGTVRAYLDRIRTKTGHRRRTELANYYSSLRLPSEPEPGVTLGEVLVELRAIRGLLEQQGICPYGSTGICMSCIQPTLDGIEMAVRDAVKKPAPW